LIVRRIGRTDGQRLRVGIGFCMDTSDVAACVGDFCVTHHDMQVELRTLSVPTQLVALSEGRLDVGFVRPPITDLAIVGETVINERLVSALPLKHPLASRREVQLRALAKESFIFVPHRDRAR
jgi:DNA-binding transcriptional LysR family regulator